MKQVRGEEHRARSAARRGDIDGLRAIAVLGVVLFHAGAGGVRGGFVGVDVFLVISGYLITGNVVRAQAAGGFALAMFYQRRFVRIVPVLAVVVLATLGVGAVVLLPIELRALGWSAAAAAGSVANVYFHATTGYFASAGEAQPLLHTWSLGVEEQFYQFYPVLLVAVARRHWPVRRVVGAIGAGSFVLGLVQAQVQPTAGFYLLPARAWELALGAWLAAGPVRWRAGQRTRCGREVASAVGVALIVLAMVAIKPDLPFPTPTALLPCVGVALVLAYGAGTRAAAWLAVAPLRWIGAISYSVYLWHWPIVTFYRLRAGVTLSMGAAAMLVRRRSAWARCRTI